MDFISLLRNREYIQSLVHNPEALKAALTKIHESERPHLLTIVATESLENVETLTDVELDRGIDMLEEAATTMPQSGEHDIDDYQVKAFVNLSAALSSRYDRT